jgi:tetratricopeptide (TPR) repeat protein
MFQKILDVKNGVVTSSKAKVQSVKNDENTAADKRLNNVVNMNIYLQEAANYGAKGQFDLALKNYLLVLEKYPDNLAIHQNIGLCKFEQKKFKEAIPYLEKSLGDPKLNDGKSEYYLGICYLNTQNKAKGCSFLNTAKNKKYPNAAQIIEQYCK